MDKKIIKTLRSSELSRAIITQIRNNSKKKVRIMEVCGTHTVAIFRSGIRSLLPKTIELCSGPGCPVCVTSQKEIDTFIMLAKYKEVIIVTFGDILKVPGSNSTLQKEKANGANIQVVYSVMDAIIIAKENPTKKIIFIGVGFETTAPTIAAAIVSAKQSGITNFYIISAHKLVPPALEAIANNIKVNIDGFILPGHVSVMIGTEAYFPFYNRYHIPCVITGFEITDLLSSILMLINQIEFKNPKIENSYARAVSPKGNLKAMQLLNEVFETIDTEWRGIGIIPKSGLILKDKYSMFDAKNFFKIEYKNTYNPKGCSCGEILMGIKSPLECSLYKKACTPITPIGPCMVSSEGTCAAYYRYNNDIDNY